MKNIEDYGFDRSDLIIATAVNSYLKNLTPDEAKAVMENSGLYLQTKGSYRYYSVVTDQDYAPGETVPRGTTITVELTDQTALD